jgi:enamine deaminase RidA (YjgF/YER057c/UK114 family)
MSARSAWLGAALLALVVPSVLSAQSPAIRRLNPPALSTPTGYTHVVEASGGRTLYISGQVAMDSTGRLVGAGDFRAQVEHVFANLQRALAAADATFEHVVKINVFVTDASQVAVLREVRSRYMRADALPASTFVQVVALARPEWLVEIEAVAVVR